MTLNDNFFIRGYNSIYQQVPRLKATDTSRTSSVIALRGMICVEKHHHYEEITLFPAIDEAVSEKGVMDGEFAQHGGSEQDDRSCGCLEN